MSIVPTTYADAKIQTDRLGELFIALGRENFAMLWVEPGQYWVIRDDKPRADESSAA